MSHVRVWKVVTATILWLQVTAGFAFADTKVGAGINPGERLGEWIYQNVTALFAPILAAVSIYYLAKRQFTRFLSFAAFAVVVSLFVYGGTEFKDAAVNLSKWIIGR